MALFTVKESSAASAVGTDLLANTFFSNAGTLRRVTRAALVGSATIGDAAVDIFAGSTFLARLYNTTAGANVIPVEAKDYVEIESDTVAEPFEPLRALISDAGATNVLVLAIEFEEL